MGKVEDAVASFERNIEAQTGRSVPDWSALAAAQNLAKHGQIMAWLKAEHGLSHSHANHVAKRTTAAAAPDPEGDPVAPLFAGKEALRPLYDGLIAIAVSLGDDVEIAPKKANVSIRRRKQFALIQPSTRTRLDLGLILKDRPAGGRLEPSGSFNAMFTHRIKLAAPSDLDDEIRAWLRDAYEAAG